MSGCVYERDAFTKGFECLDLGIGQFLLSIATRKKVTHQGFIHLLLRFLRYSSKLSFVDLWHCRDFHIKELLEEAVDRHWSPEFAFHLSGSFDKGSLLIGVGRCLGQRGTESLVERCIVKKRGRSRRWLRCGRLRHGRLEIRQLCWRVQLSRRCTLHIGRHGAYTERIRSGSGT